MTEKKRRKVVSGRLKFRFYNCRRMFIDVGLISKSTLAAELASDEELRKYQVIHSCVFIFMFVQPVTFPFFFFFSS